MIGGCVDWLACEPFEIKGNVSKGLDTTNVCSYTLPMALAVVPDREPEDWERLEARVAELSGLLNTAHAALLDTIAEVIDTGSWGGYGYRSPEHWVTLHCGVSVSRAREFVAAARRVNDLPACAEAFRAGELSVDQATVVLRRTPVDRDGDVASVAPTATVGQLRRMVAALPPLPVEADPDEPDVPARPVPPRPADETRTVRRHYTDDGTYILHSEMPADVGAVVDKAFTAALADLLDNATPGVDNVDALAHIMNLALDHLDPAVTATGGRASDRYQVVIHVDAQSGAAQTHLGVWLPENLGRYLTCDSPMRLAIHQAGEDSVDRLIGITPTARTVDPKLRAQIEHRDRGCRIPGCDQTRRLHIHHIRHHKDGGLTIPANLIALCPFHHRLHHRGIINISGDPEKPGTITITDRWGDPIGPAPPQPPRRDQPLRDPAAQHNIADGRNWNHPWGTPLDTRMFGWRH